MSITKCAELWSARGVLRVFMLMGFIKKEVGYMHRYIRKIPLRSPMSIFSKSPDLEKCAVEQDNE